MALAKALSMLETPPLSTFDSLAPAYLCSLVPVCSNVEVLLPFRRDR
jgi:hypothetical protein